ncbi:MAG TPA: hypothetical protein VFZ56_00070 [Gemmatimonadaceae bacterium]
MTERVAHHVHGRGMIAGLVAVAGLIACAELNDSGHWFPDARRYQGECIPPQEDEGGCWWFAFTPAGRVDFTSGSDIAYIGEYRINGDRVRVTAAQHSDLDLRLSADQDTLWLPQGSYILRTK